MEAASPDGGAAFVGLGVGGPLAGVDEWRWRGIELTGEHGGVRRGDTLVLTAGSAGVPAATNILRIVRVGE